VTALAARALPEWLRHYRRDFLGHDLVAGLIVWSVVVPQAVAYAQIAGLDPAAGLVAAPGALVVYALLGTSRSLVVSATTATSAISAAAVGPLADGDAARFAALSAALAVVTGAVLAAAGIIGIGGLTDLVSKPVMTGFLFGLALTVSIGQVPKLFGVSGSDGNFFEQLNALLGKLDDASGWTVVVGVGSVAALLALRFLAPKLPGTLIVLVAAVVLSALLGLEDRGVAVVGDLPSAYPTPAWPDVSGSDLVDLLAPALGVMLLTTEGVGVARAIGTAQGYHVDANRELTAIGGSNLAAGLTSGFVQSGGASQTLAAESAGGKTQVTSIVAAVLILLTGAFLAPLFRDLPQATLGAIVVVAISSFYRVDELRRFARLRQSAIVLSLTALIGVLVFNILPGLLIAAALSLIFVIKRLARPPVGALGRDPATGAFGHVERHPGWEPVPGVLIARVDGPMFYANAFHSKQRLLELVDAADPPPQTVVIDASGVNDLDVETLDSLAELEATLRARGIELRLAAVRARPRELLERSGLADRIGFDPTLEAVSAGHSPRAAATASAMRDRTAASMPDSASRTSLDR
jgi:high affinity sulfate transporter 1